MYCKEGVNEYFWYDSVMMFVIVNYFVNQLVKK